MLEAGIHVRLPESQVERLKQQADLRGLTLSALVRQELRGLLRSADLVPSSGRECLLTNGPKTK